jgi:predicted lipoprotein with Yx(FWY)xxD motif
MRKVCKVWLASLGGIGALVAAAMPASAAGKPEFAPLATPFGIQIQPLGTAAGYTLSAEAAAGTPHVRVVFANERGMSLYFSDADVDGTPRCMDECAKTFIPALAPANANPSVEGWSLVDRADGSKQWALRGKPLYTYVKDVDIGSVGGNSPKVWGRGELVGPRGYLRGPMPKELPLPDGWHAAMFFPAENSLPPGFRIRQVEDVVGLVLTNHAGHTLYVLDGDVNKDKKICGTMAACVEWQPVAAPRVSAPYGDFGLVSRADGIKQWTYKGKGLYSYAGDLVPMDANGIGIHQAWSPAYIVRHFVPANVIVTTTRKLGKVWATAQGQTLYKRQGYIYQSGSGHAARRGDTVRPAVGRDIGTNPRCQKECDRWHPFLAPANAQPSGYWDVATREDDQKQWVYQGYALWTYDGDKVPGEINGNDTFDFFIGQDNKTVINPGIPYDWPTSLYWIVSYP